MKKYLNSNVKQNIIIIDVLLDHVRTDILPVWEKSKAMKDEKVLISRLKQATTLMFNELGKYLSQFEESDVQAVIRKKGQCEVALVPKTNYAEMEKNMESRYWMSEEQTKDLTTALIEVYCRKCTIECSKCDIRDLFMKWNIPGLEGEIEGCQYKPD